MQRMTTIVLRIVFPGMIGFLVASVLILPQLILQGMGFALSLTTGVMLSGIFSALVAALLRNRIKVAVPASDEGHGGRVLAE